MRQSAPAVYDVLRDKQLFHHYTRHGFDNSKQTSNNSCNPSQISLRNNLAVTKKYMLFTEPAIIKNSITSILYETISIIQPQAKYKLA